MKTSNRFAALCGVIGACVLCAQPAAASEDLQNWETLTINVALPDNFKVQNETVVRSGEARGFYEVENALMVGKKLNKKITVWAGYVFNPLYNRSTFNTREHRFRQQVNFDNVIMIGKAKIGGRLRLEERWREGSSGTGWRLRPQVKISMPLVGKANLNLSNETFFNLNTTTFQRVNGLDRMRNAISVSAPLNKTFNVEFGYLNQHGFVRGGTDSSDNVITLGLTASF